MFPLRKKKKRLNQLFTGSETSIHPFSAAYSCKSGRKAEKFLSLVEMYPEIRTVMKYIKVLVFGPKLPRTAQHDNEECLKHSLYVWTMNLDMLDTS